MQKFKLVHEEARKRAMDAVYKAPQGYVVRVSPPSRTLDQNAKLHAMITVITDTQEWDGEKLTKDQWKQLFVAGWMMATNRKIKNVRAIEGGMTSLYQRTSDLSVSEESELIDYIQAWMAENIG